MEEPTILIISTQPSSVEAQVGQYTGFVCKAETIPESSNTISYTWEKFSVGLNRWLKFLDETSARLIFEQVQAYDAGRYRCKVEDSSSSNSPIYSREVTLSTYMGVLNLTKDTTPVSLFVGQTLALEVNSSTNVRGIATLYSWEKSPDGQTDWKSILGENNQKFSIASVRSGDSGYYRCVVSNAGAENSPVYSSAVEVDVKDVLINLTTTVPSPISIVEGKAFSIGINALLNDLRLPSFTFEKKQGTDWIFYTVNNTGVLSFDRTPLSFAGTYRCRVSDYLAANSPVFTSEFTFTVSDSFSAGDISQSPASFTIGQTATLSANPIIDNADLRYSYQWQRQKAGGSVWEDVANGRKKDLVFDQVRGEVYVDKFRCKISNNVGTEKISSEFSSSFNPFVFVSENPQSEILFKKEIEQDGIDTVERTFALEPVIISTSPASVSYQWQISTDNQATWQDISGQTSSTLELTETEIIALYDGDFYLRLKLTLGGTSTYTDPTFINAKDRLRFFGNCFDQLGVDALNDIGIDANILNPGDKCDDVNTCGMSAAELVDKYPIYDFQKGVYNTWGGVEFPWEISNLVSNLDFAATDDKWNISTYRAVITYFAGDRAIFFEKDGKRLSLFEAKEDIPVGDPAYDFSKWARVCYIDTNVPVGFPTIAELKDRFDYYAPEFYRENWGEFSEAWNKDLGDPDSDHWGNAKIKKDFFYRRGDVVLVDTVCEDALCIYVAVKDMPATQEVYDAYVPFALGEYWSKIYCVDTGYNKCLQYKRDNTLSNYELLEIGSKGHFVERPIPYNLDPSTPTLNEKVEQKLNPAVLTPREILDLDTNTYPYTADRNT